MKKTTSERLKEYMNMTGLRQVDILEKCKPFCEKYNVRIGKNDLSQYTSGKVMPRQEKLSILGMALNVNEAWLMGYDVSMERDRSNPQHSLPSNTIPLATTVKVPLLGNIACGSPVLAVENIEDYIDMDKSVHADFALRCKGDSMINARILDGDIVYIRKQDNIENGEIAAVLIDECTSISEATLKRVYIYEDKIRLCAENPQYKDKVFFENDMNKVRILGKAVAFLSSVN